MLKTLFLILILLFGLSGVSYAERVPVVLVHGLGSDPEKTWDTLIKEFRSAGYERDIDLFVFDYSYVGHNDFVRLADNEFASFVEDVSAETGSTKIDIVAHSMGGLISRRYAANNEGVRNLVLVAVPNRGSFLADFWYVTEQKTAEESLRRKEGLYRNVRELDFYAGMATQSFSDYIAKRSFGLHEPLYHRFVVEDIFFVSPKDRGEAKEYEEWLEINYPDELYAGEYFLSHLYSGGEIGVGLTPLYYEKVAIDTAKYLYRQLLSPSEVLISGFEKDIVIGPTIKESIILTAKERFLSIIKGMGERWLKGTFLNTSLKWSLDWLGLSSTVGLERLVRETFFLYENGEESLANLTLAELNGVDKGETRYVSILGETPNVWSLIGEIGSNDLAVEHESSWLPLGYNDSFRLFNRFFATNHSWLLNDKRVTGHIIRELQWPQATIMSKNEREVLLRHSEPGYLRIDKSLYSPDRDLRVIASEGVLLWVMVYSDEWQIVSVGEEEIVVSAEWLNYEQWLVGLRLEGDELDILKNDQGKRVSVSIEQDKEISIKEKDVPIINVIRRSKLTTTKKESEWRHAFWEWDYGDGYKEIIHTQDAKISVGYQFSKEGTYEVTAVSYTEDEREIVRFTWEVEVEATGSEYIFHGYTVLPPYVEISLEGPKNWVTGLPAEYTVKAKVGEPPLGEVVELSYHPGERFVVVWERPGEFQIQGGITVKVSYILGDRKRTYYHTYIVEDDVTVYATSQ